MSAEGVRLTGFVYFECPVCEWDCVLNKRESELGLTCPLCAGDSGRDVYLRSREAVTEDRPEGLDERTAETGGRNEGS